MIALAATGCTSEAVEAKTVTPSIRVKFFTTGRVGSVSFHPAISPDVVRCARAVASGWILDTLPEAISVEYQTRLKPQ